MFKRFKGIIVLGVVLLIVGTSLVLAADPETIDPTTRPVPWRVQVREILERHPEVLAEIEALQPEIAELDVTQQQAEGRGFFGFFGPRHMARGQQRGYMMNCWRGVGPNWAR